MYSETSYPFADYVGFSLCDFYFQLLVVAIAWKKKPGHSNKKMLKEIVESEDDDESIRAVTIYRDRSEESSRERKKERKLFRETELPQARFSSPKSRAACSAPFSFLTTTVRSVCWHFTLNMGKITWTRAVKCIETERLFYSSARVFLSTFGFWPASLMGLLNFHMVHWAARWARPS